MKLLALKFIRFYQKYGHSLIPAGACRFDPTCSNYAYEAVAKYGTMTGIYLTLKRLGRCNLFFKGGYDPLP